jgi:hypothetical protein
MGYDLPKYMSGGTCTMIRRTVLMAAALAVASVFFASAAQAGSYTPPSSDPAAVESDQVGTASASGSGSLPATGSNTTEDLLRVGIILVAAGGMIAFVARRVAVARR